MRLFRLLLISVIILFVVVAGMSLFIPSHVRISRAVNLKADSERVLGKVNDPVQWKSWYPGLDSSRLLYEKGKLEGVYFTSAPEPYLRLREKKADEVIAEFGGARMNPVVNGWKVITHPGADSSVLQWYMDFNLRWYPWEKFASLLLEKSYGPKMEEGLNNLKKQVEN